jgi:hypothetical protein
MANWLVFLCLIVLSLPGIAFRLPHLWVPLAFCVFSEPLLRDGLRDLFQGWVLLLRMPSMGVLRDLE